MKIAVRRRSCWASTLDFALACRTNTNFLRASAADCRSCWGSSRPTVSPSASTASPSIGCQIHRRNRHVRPAQMDANRRRRRGGTRAKAGSGLRAIPPAEPLPATPGLADVRDMDIARGLAATLCEGIAAAGMRALANVGLA